ncbi:MAG: ferritin-like domain-containing protein [Bryobacterales bacterium]|nr:ferritin-like domain-containing protein [Bryobacterales bacterium]MBV9396615.1 ferritin-like domain-containing protein [Bryobacterales bacterium]
MARNLAADSPTKLSSGDVAILKFLAAAEIIESDLWTQYSELGGVEGGNPAYMAALQNLDADMSQYISDNTDDELSHAAFLNAYLVSKGEQPVSLDQFRNLPSSQATGAQQKGRLTNLMKLDVDTSFYTRYRSDANPDFGATFPQAVNIRNQPAIPLNDTDTPPQMDQPIPPETKTAKRMQAIANSASFHFGFIEQGGSSLYPTLALQVSNVEVLKILLSIGGVEIDHFGLWHDKMGNAVSQPLAGVTDPETGTTFPDLNDPANQVNGAELSQTNLILPEPCRFLVPDVPCSIIRPMSTANSGAVATINAFIADNLFLYQSGAFIELLMQMANAADSAKRNV